ncbi:hypothetical protein [uncultured Pedobacter sp.]|uniref:hypothetical protein n=1 Tax=uncultured Pedobacter sp. TaxID=246139 RepID=UPI00261CD79B|nr:hypothetical protein [uncultured Pedobacter sp.]
MNLENSWSTIFPWLLGTATAIVGFFIKYVVDYFWLKSPKINVKAALIAKTTEPPHNNFRKYNYELQLEIQNHSKNPAYGLQLNRIVMPTGLHLKGSSLREEYEHVVSDVVTAKIFGPCTITLPVSDSDASKTGSQRVNDFGNEIKVDLSYKNELGKRYSTTKIVTFEKKLSIVNSVKVISFRSK